MVTDESLTRLLATDLRIDHSLSSHELKQFLHSYEIVFGRSPATVTLQSTSMPIVHLTPDNSNIFLSASIQIKNPLNANYTAAALTVFLTATFELTQTDFELTARITDLQMDL